MIYFNALNLSQVHLKREGKKIWKEAYILCKYEPTSYLEVWINMLNM